MLHDEIRSLRVCFKHSYISLVAASTSPWEIFENYIRELGYIASGCVA